MKLWQLNSFAAAICVLAVYGCTSSGDDDAAATSGKGGKGGSAGSTASGGKSASGGRSASGGKSGTGGTSAAGSNSGGAGGESASGTGAAAGQPASGGAAGAGGATGGEAGLGGAAGAATVDVTGKWDIEEVIPSSQAFAGTYAAVFTLKETGDKVAGTAVWDGDVMSTLTGTVHGRKIHLDRVDASGFRAFFDGRVSANGNSMSGTGIGDPSSPGGNSSTYTWTAAIQ